ncbi:MAG: RAD55 family ATPase [Nitrososphaerales archaeon]|nr:RAD55 family ATPase [Nitrososphaerales archaeon]
MVERFAIGVPELDQILQGGLAKGTICTVLGPPGAGKSILSKRFIFTGIQGGKDAFLIATTEGEGDVGDTMKQFKWTQGLDRLHVLDCYSWRFGGNRAKYSASASSLTEVSMTLTRMLDDTGVTAKGDSRFVVDSFTDFIKNAGLERALKLLDAIRGKLKSRGMTGLVLMEEGVHDEKANSSVEYATDGTIRMKLSDQGRFMMVSRMSATQLSPKWIPYAIGR